MLKKFLKNKLAAKTNILELKGDDVIAETRNWYQDRYSSLIVQRNFLVLLTIALTITTSISVVYLDRLAEKKVVKPFVIEVNERSGETKVVNAVNQNFVDSQDSLHTHFLVRFLKAYEGYDSLYYNQDTTEVRLMSSDEVYYSYIRRMVGDRGIVKSYGDKVTIQARIRSISFLERGSVAQIRFALVTEGRDEKPRNKIATIRYGFTPMSLTEEERFSNPLGFRVNKYVVDDEISPN